MNGLDKMLYLKMGNKLIFKEPLKGIKYAVDQYQNQNSNINRNNMYNIYKPGYNQQSNTSNQSNAQNKYNMNNNNNTRKLRLQNMDVIPKFIYYENDQEMNKELANKLFEKKNKLNTLVNTYISKDYFDFNKSIMDIELEMDKYKSIMEQQKDKDFEGFKDLLNFINHNRTNENLKEMQSISLNEYKNMNYDIKKKVLSGIYENREDISKKLNIYVNANAPNNSNNKAHKRLNTINYNNQGNNINNNRNNNNYDINNYEVMNQKKNNMMNSQITQEQIDLFKILVNNPQMQNNHVITYFNKFNPKVKEAAENYFKNIYRLDYITLNYKYKNKEGKVHKFRFSGEVDALFAAAQGDYIIVNQPRLFLENGKEILKNKKVKCIGALNLENNANIHVWY